MPNNIHCKYSLFDEGRTYTGHHRKYLLENAREVCYAPETREKIKLREAYGYYGHGRRQLTGKVDISEVGVATMPNDDQIMIDNIPSNVTIQFDIDMDGLVTHTQQILNTESGKIVSGLHDSKVGGFSWAFHGSVSGQEKLATLTGFSGFDYVLQPGFAHNKGYVLESVNNGGDSVAHIILESVANSLGVNQDVANLIAQKWLMDAQSENIGLQEALFESTQKYAELKAENNILMKSVRSMTESSANATTAVLAEREKFKGILEGLQSALPVFLPAYIFTDMLNGNYERAHAVFESIKIMDFSQFPLNTQKKSHKQNCIPHVQEVPEWGSTSYGFSLDL